MTTTKCCPWCGASGLDFGDNPMPSDYCDHDITPAPTAANCQNCGGDGYSIEDGPCPACEGTGKEAPEEWIGGGGRAYLDGDMPEGVPHGADPLDPNAYKYKDR